MLIEGERGLGQENVRLVKIYLMAHLKGVHFSVRYLFLTLQQLQQHTERQIQC